MITLAFIREQSRTNPVSKLRWSEMIFDFDGWQFTVHWTVEDPMHDVSCANPFLKNLILDAIHLGETDDNPNLALYLFIRDFRPGLGMEPEAIKLEDIAV